MINLKRNIPNIVTIIRILLAFAFLFLFIYKLYHLSITIFVVGALSDALDGFLARRLKAESKLGKKMDAFADKLFTVIPLLCLSIIFNPLFSLLILLELISTIINIRLYSKHKLLYISMLGKLKMALLFITVTVGLMGNAGNRSDFLLYFLIIATFITQCIAISGYINKFRKLNYK
jgi:phosphatidylglycerophosphate synthase